MVDVSILNETSPEANWNRRADRQADRQATLCVGRLRLQKPQQQHSYNNNNTLTTTSNTITISN